MAKILFIMDAEEGHLLASFGLAHSLAGRGHSVIFLSIRDNEALITEQGFQFYPLFENIYYKGYRKAYKELAPAPGAPRIKSGLLQDAYTRHVTEAMNGTLDEILNRLQADIYIVSFFLQMDMLILYYRYGIRPIIFTSAFREKGITAAMECADYLGNVSPDELSAFVDFIEQQGLNVISMEQVTRPFNDFCELVVCPREFALGDEVSGPNVHFIGPSIRHGSASQNFHSLYNIPFGKKIILASMGSQLVRYGDTCALFFQKVIDAMRSEELQDCHLVLAIGSSFSEDLLPDLPSGVTVARWVPQVDLLQSASAAIIHGGLGSVKECIYYGVPMIVFPLGFDQPANAKRVAFHHLGFAGDIVGVSANQIKEWLIEIMTNPAIKKGIGRMQSVFRQEESAHSGAKIIEQLLARQSQPVPH